MRRFVVIPAALLTLVALVGMPGARALSRPKAQPRTLQAPLNPGVTQDSCTGESAQNEGTGPLIAGTRPASMPRDTRSSADVAHPAAPVPPSARVPTARPDFNGDGFADLAVSVVCEDVGAILDAGAVNVIYGSSIGLDASAGPGNQWWTQDSPGILDQAESSDQFSHVMTPGDFNGDGYDDLVVASREDLEGTPTLVDAGALNVIYGSPNGLDASAGPGNQFWTADSTGVKGVAAQGDLFGRALAAGDFNRDGFEDLAIGIPNKDGPTGIKDSGAVSVLYGTAAGLTAAHNQLWSQDSQGILDKREWNDQFGRALSAADFNGDGFVDLAIGPRHESLEGPPLIKETGAVNVIYGTTGGLNATAGPGNQFWTQDSPGLPTDGSEDSDWWGRPLKSADFNNDGFADLAIAAFQEDLEESPTILDAGAVTIIYGGPSGLQSNAGPGAQWFTQDTQGIAERAEANDWFGRWDAGGDFNNDGFADLVLGEPGEDLGTGPSRIDSAGAVNVIYGGPNGLSAIAGPGDQFWDQDSPGILDQAETHDWFAHGHPVGADFNGDGVADVAIGVIFEDYEGSPTVLDAGGINVIYGATVTGLSATAGPGNQFWNENSAGINGDGAEDSDAYGGTLAALGSD
jgi:hypothetical protein